MRQGFLGLVFLMNRLKLQHYIARPGTLGLGFRLPGLGIECHLQH